MNLNIVYVFLLVVICTVDHVASWLSVLRTLPLANAKQLKKNATHIIYGKYSKLIVCRKDRHCKPVEFCHRYEKSCRACKTEGQMCRRNKMCCRGMECAGGKCRKRVALGRQGALCSKDRDCNYGFCCARENGQSICKPMLRQNEACGIPKGGRRFLWTHQCPCAHGLKCKRAEKEETKSRSKLVSIIRDWTDDTERRCLPPNET
ncbi:dickkopf-related protein 3-like [Hydractinia symbiolongicarpus]|uniref:dickkopf-related protein 3-like n=1 Tax=Hydractinia symbiolongicarpus TaxID=13093 RepID=UPI002549FA89|nr:dickkopf-related protein 3-like [Hydractinia symbiolongicarpus]